MTKIRQPKNNNKLVTMVMKSLPYNNADMLKLQYVF